MQEMQEMWVQPLDQEDPSGGGYGSPLQCSCLENPMDRGAWWATVREVEMSQTRLKPLTTDHQEGACAPRNDGLIHKFAHLLQKAVCDRQFTIAYLPTFTRY